MENIMHCLLCKHGANEITECTPIDGVIVCGDCAHDEALFGECEYCLHTVPSDELVEADDERQTHYCKSCVPQRYSENDAPTFGDKGWISYRSAVAREALTTTTTDLGNALSNMLKAAS